MIDWVVHVKPPFGGPRRALKYLARYTHRVAISNHRLRSLEKRPGRFEWKDYADRSRTKLMTLDAIEFLRRFLLHILPSGLVRIRQFGFLANRVRKHQLQLCRALLAAGSSMIPHDLESDPVHADPQPCPACKLGRLRLIELLSPSLTRILDTSCLHRRSCSNPKAVTPLGASRHLCVGIDLASTRPTSSAPHGRLSPAMAA